MAFKLMIEINTKLKFLHRQNKILTPVLHRLLCYAPIQPYFDPNPIQKMKNNTQTTLNLLYSVLPANIMIYITLNWLPV